MKSRRGAKNKLKPELMSVWTHLLLPPPILSRRYSCCNRSLPPIQCYNTTQIKPYLWSDETAAAFIDILQHFFITRSFKSFHSSDSLSPFDIICKSFTTKDNAFEYSQKKRSSAENSSMARQITEVIGKSDPRVSFAEIKDALLEKLGNFFNSQNSRLCWDKNYQMGQMAYEIDLSW